MQPNSPNKPVMDVTPSGNQASPLQHQPEQGTPEVRSSSGQNDQHSSAEHQNAAPEQAPEQPPSAPENSEKAEQKQPRPAKPKSTLPTGVITAAVFIMIVLAGLAVVAYMTSQ